MIEPEAVELTEVNQAAERPGYEPVSSTLWRQREEYCARLIQNAWRRHKTVLSKSEIDCHKLTEGTDGDDNENEGSNDMINSDDQERVLIPSRPSPIMEEDHNVMYQSSSPSASNVIHM